MLDKCSFGQEGFSLLETLVSLVVLAGTVTLILQLFSTNMKAIHLSKKYQNAVFFSQMKLEEMLTENEIPIPIKEGLNKNGLRWRITTTPVINGSNFKNSRLYRLEVLVQWPAGNKSKTISLSTLKIYALK